MMFQPTFFTTPPLCEQIDILYDFKVCVKPSQIPNSGSGAYLTYLGARLLKADRRFRSNDLLINSSISIVETTKPLTAAFRSTGLRASITLTGKDLHENDGNDFWPDTADWIEGIMPTTKKRFTLKLTGKNIHDTGEDLLHSRDLQPGETPIGFRRYHKESHYEEVPLPFCSYYEDCGFIDIGRYGPFRREGKLCTCRILLYDAILCSPLLIVLSFFQHGNSDRMTDLNFSTKNFLFEHEPAGMCHLLRLESQLLRRCGVFFCLSVTYNFLIPFVCSMNS